MDDKKQKDEQYDEEETVRRREAAIKRMLRTPHKPHKRKDRQKTSSSNDTELQ